MELVEVALQAVDRLVQTSGNQLVDAAVAPAGQGEAAEAFELVWSSWHRLAAHDPQGFVDALQAVAHRARKDRVEQQEAGHRLGLDRLLARLTEHLIGPGAAQQGDPLQFIEHAAHLIR